ncbi:hypothetical protein M441DRAFT_64889 [Trichoderma asperellum CBS 433.97]|uniref:Protein kinase domain-containing protein n=1 Tax=Trichoderma asperellum (strain ATCC 204424 / CBS 433.97 / NBRC 101777) TaxID=1042311 RepID=A0A2T3ZK82_TRIA4|nr:hypothetical protein M441DRAFT_64889 [Trichoderma asperellum CBS 433.97]PTB45219.1 hypothetical protein M441DRAFT_64889 [Trichoderma asperellum CBS 433.97]
MSDIPPGLYRERAASPPRPVETVTFRLRTRSITGVGEVYNSKHRNVRRLTIQPKWFDKVVTAALSICPKFAQPRLQKWFPEWYLPRNIVLKTQKPNWVNEFHAEIKFYRALEPLQGIYIPQYLGATEFNGVKSHVLSDVGGICMADIDGDDASIAPAVEKLFRHTISTVASLGYYQNDMRLDNFHLVGDKIVIVDLEQMGVFSPRYNLEPITGFLVQKMTAIFSNYQQQMRDRYTSDLFND